MFPQAYKTYRSRLLVLQIEPVHNPDVEGHAVAAQAPSAGEEAQRPPQHCPGALVL